MSNNNNWEMPKWMILVSLISILIKTCHYCKEYDKYQEDNKKAEQTEAMFSIVEVINTALGEEFKLDSLCNELIAKGDKTGNYSQAIANIEERESILNALLNKYTNINQKNNKSKDQTIAELQFQLIYECIQTRLDFITSLKKLLKREEKIEVFEKKKQIFFSSFDKLTTTLDSLVKIVKKRNKID